MQKLTPADWRQVLELLDTALELPVQARAGWLATLDESRANLRPALHEMLARHDAKDTDDFLKALPQFTRVELDVDSHAELRPEALIGAYRLIRELGRGGMSVVWLAERVDGKFKRQVALKFPYTGPAQRELAERLAREREILAGLEHSNIARLYDADATSSGAPFLVLEYVDGIPINDYCDGHRLPPRARLELFLQVFQAVQYAHTHLVIHRDLKPSNILMTADGIVHLLDFGIAKLISQDSAADAALTEFGTSALTPDYASPEQIGGRPLTTASDIYSLGVVLYELLAGARPYRLKRDSRASLEEAIAEADVIPPSRAVADASVTDKRASSARQLARSLAGDPDTIVLKALKKEPTERYATAEEMGEDVRRYLDGRPVRARPATLGYRARRFVSRYSWPVAIGSVTAVSLIAALIMTINAMVDARNERDLAASRLADVRHLANVFLFDVDAKISDIAGTTEARQLLVTTGLSYLDRMAADAGDDASLLREIARGYDKLGDIQGSVLVSNLGQTDSAMVSYRKASSLRRLPAITQSNDPEVLRESAHGEQRLADALFRIGKLDEMREHAAAGVALLTRAASLSTGPARMDTQRERAEAQTVHGFAIAADGDLPGGLKILREAMAFYEHLPPAQLDDAQYGRGYAFALFRGVQVLGELPDNQGANEALELLTKAVAMDRKMLAAAPARADLHRGLARDLAKLGGLLAKAERHEKALAPFAESLQLWEEEIALDSRDKLPRRNIDQVRTGEGQSLLALGRIEEARARIVPAVDDLLALLEEDPRNVSVQINFGSAANAYQKLIALQARKHSGSQDPQLRRAISLLDRADELLKPLVPKLTGDEAQIVKDFATGRRESRDLLFQSAKTHRT